MAKVIPQAAVMVMRAPWSVGVMTGVGEAAAADIASEKAPVGNGKRPVFRQHSVWSVSYLYRHLRSLLFSSLFTNSRPCAIRNGYSMRLKHLMAGSHCLRPPGGIDSRLKSI